MELDLMFLKKTPPHSQEAEKTVLGGILVNNKNLNVVLSIISIEDFYKEGNRKILEKIAQLVDRGLPVDLLSLSEELKKSGDLDEIGGASYLSSLMDGVPRSLNVEYYAHIIKEKALLRRLILSSAKIISSSYEQREDADQLLDEAQASIIEVAEQRIKPGFVPVGALTEPALDTIDALRSRQDAVTGVPTGFRVPIRDIRPATGAGYLYPLLGEMRTMPGLSKKPAAVNVDIDVETGAITGLF